LTVRRFLRVLPAVFAPGISTPLRIGFGALLTVAIWIGRLPAADTEMIESVKTVAVTPDAGARGYVARSLLTTAENEELVDIEIPLRLRNLPEMLGRIGRGERIDASEMASRYYPPAADYARVSQWLVDRGLTILPPDSHFAIFARGSVARCAQTFHVSFARVAADDGEYSSAVTVPRLPADIAALVTGVHGLQPHIHPRKHIVFQPSWTNSFAPPYLPSQIALAYGASNLPLNGAGQKIAIVIDTFPSSSDLTTFWSFCSVGQSLTNIEEVKVVSGTLPAPSGEESLDVEWSSSIAPGAKVRIYATKDLSFIHLDQAYATIVNDLPANPSMRVLSLSYGAGETFVAPSQLQTDAQFFAELANGGVTVLVTSGDGGSSPGTDGHSTNGPVQTETPASDPSVTAVGGTTLSLDPASGAITGETAWVDGGGGVSGVFSRPVWQNFPGAPTGSTRLVPDVAAAADPNTGGFLVLKGVGYEVGGTSWSAPVWAGFFALINQSRAAAAAGPLGLAGPSLYPLLGSASFRDITQGNNGPNDVYDAGAGFDLCTGLGVPDVTALIAALTPAAPTITTQPSNVSVIGGQTAIFAVAAGGNPPPTYRWQVSSDGGNTWADLSDGPVYQGAATATLQVNTTDTGLNGFKYRCIISNLQGTLVSNSVTLAVTEAGGDVPAMPAWALALLAFALGASALVFLRNPRRRA
jgi:kumamolisin